MKLRYFLATFLAVSLGFSSKAQTYEQWGMTSIGYDWDTTANYGEFFEFTFTSLPLGAHGNARLIVYQDGDFGDGSETCEVFDSGTLTSLGNTAPNYNGDCTLDSSQIVFDASQLDIWQNAGEWILRVTPTDQVDFFCSGLINRAKARLVFDYCEFGTPVEYASMTLSEESVCPHSTVTLIGSPANGTFSGTGINGTVFNPNGLNAGNYTITYTATDAIGCETSTSETVRVLKTPGDQSFLVCEGGNSPVIEPANKTFAYGYDIDFMNQIDITSGYSHGPIINSPEIIYYANFIINDALIINEITNDNSNTIDHDFLTGDDRGGIAITDSTVYVVGDNNIGRYDLELLEPGVSLPVRDGLFSDLKERKIWSLYNTDSDEMPFDWPNNYVVNAIIALDADLMPTAEIVTFSEPITMGNYNMDNNGIFAGHGKLGLYSGDSGEFWVIDIASGNVELINQVYLDLYWSENWADWGVLGFDGTDYFAYYRDNDIYQIVSYNLTDDTKVAVSNFSDVSDLSSFIIHPDNNRLYFHYEGGAQFGGSSETLGYVDADFTIVENPDGEIGCPSVLEFTFNSINLGADTTICQNSTPLILEAGNEYNSYTWNGDANNWNIFPVMASGTYTVEATDNANCIITDEITVTIEACLGIDELEAENFQIFPNPSNGDFTIQLLNSSNIQKIDIIDLQGKVVYKQSPNQSSDSMNIHIQGLDSGVYFVRIETPENISQKQIIVTK